MVPVFGIPRVPGEAYNWVGWPAYLSNLAITENITHSRVVLGPLWTLPVEVQMYGFLPFLYMALQKGRYRSLSHWILSALASLAVALIFPGRLNVVAYSQCFVAGIVTYDIGQVVREWITAWLWPITVVFSLDIVTIFHLPLRTPRI
jgi:peptidoglycan/LPS O-acetylase OafA/YrhL